MAIMALLGAMLLLPTAASAYGDPTEVFAAAGQGQLHGDVSSHGPGFPVFSLHSRKVPRRRLTMFGPVERTRVGIGIDVLSAQFRINSTPFPFDEGNYVNIVGLYLTPTTCFYSHTDYRVCLGIGLGSLNLSSKDNRQQYGSWNFQIDLHHQFMPDFFVKAIWKSIGDISQRVAGRPASFGLQTFSVGIGFYYY